MKTSERLLKILIIKDMEKHLKKTTSLNTIKKERQKIIKILKDEKITKEYKNKFFKLLFRVEKQIKEYKEFLKSFRKFKND